MCLFDDVKFRQTANYIFSPNHQRKNSGKTTDCWNRKNRPAKGGLL